MEVIRMAKRTSSNIDGMNPEKGPDIGQGQVLTRKLQANEPLTVKQKLNNKKRKKNK